MPERADEILKALGEAVVRYWTVLAPAVRAQLLDQVAPRGSVARLEIERFIRVSQSGVQWKPDGDPEPG